MNADKYKLWQDLLKEVLVLKSLQTELEKRIDALREMTNYDLNNKENSDEPN